MLDLPLSERTFSRALITQAERYADKPFLKFENAVFSYSEALAISRHLAGALQQRGLQHGSHVALLMNNHPNMLWTMFALAFLGVVVVPINAAARGSLLAYFLRHSRSAALIVDADLLPSAAPLLEEMPAIRQVIVHGQLSSDLQKPISGQIEWLSLEALLVSASPAFMGDDARFSDVQMIMYTSGTTGPSKGVMCTHAQEQTGGIFMAEQMGYNDSDVLYTCLPLFHANAIRITVTAALWAGATVALSRRFSASNFWPDIRKYEATQFNALGAIANILVQAPASPADRDHKLRICNIVPAFTENQAADFERRFHVQVTSLYGSTEMGCPIYANANTGTARWPSCGKIVAPYEMRVVDDNDFELPPGKVGEWILRSREPWYVFQGYLDMPAETMAAWRNGWFHTGDRGYMDTDGFFYFVDRKKESIRRRGENISSYEVESAICGHPGVLECAAVAVPSELGEDEVMVYVVLRPDFDLTEVELTQFCEANMAHFMVPRFIAFLPALPKTPSEKVEKYKLKQSAEQSRDSLWDREKVFGRSRSQKTSAAMRK